MSTFLTIVGGIAVVLLSIAAIGAMVAWLIHVLEERRVNLRNEAFERAISKIGKELLLDVRYFHEDQNVMFLLKEMGEYMVMMGTFDASRIRKRWREAKALAAKPAEASEAEQSPPGNTQVTVRGEKEGEGHGKD